MPTLNESIRALLRGDQLPTKLVELRDPMLEVIEELACEVAGSTVDPSEASLRQRLLSDGSQTVAIMGQRGSGKSTLLAAVTAELLRQGRHLVVPIMRPDQFGETDSVITTFLSELWDLVSEQPPASQGRSEARLARDPDAVKLLADVARGSALARTPTSALEHGTDGPIDFADDFLTVSRSGVRLTHQLRALATHLCRPLSTDADPRVIVIPIDDPDLSRHSVIDILTDLQILSAVPGLVPLTCFSPEDLNAAWIAERQRFLPDASERHIRFLLSRQMEKAFPYRFRFEIEPIAPSQRSAFIPIAGTGTMREKLAGLRSRVESITGGFWAIDEALSLDRPVFGLRNALPDNARTLVQLWETLDALESSPSELETELLHLTLRRLLSVMAEPVAVRLGLSSSSLIGVGPPLTDDGSRRALHFETGVLRILPSTSSEHAELTEPALLTFDLRKLAEVRMAIPPTGSSRPSEFSPEDYLSPEEVSATLALQEIGFGSGLFEASGTRLYFGTDDWRFLQRFQLANQATDSIFLLLPDATTLSEILRGGALWNELVDLTAAVDPISLFATGIEAACLTIEPEGELSLREDYEISFERAVELYGRCLARRGSTPRAFVQWFERDLPLQWHSALLGADRIRSLAARHREVISQPARASYPERIDTSLFDKRLGILLDALEGPGAGEDVSPHSWIAGYFELASAFGSKHLERLSHLYPSWQRDSAGVRAGAGALGTVERRSPSTLKASPYLTPEGTELLNAASTALRRARRATRTELESR